jgi:uncharacterized protein (DUF433 family)
MMATMVDTAGAEMDGYIVLPATRAAALAEVSVRRLLYWELTGLLRPSISRRLNLRNAVRLYTFTDLVALLVIAGIRRRNFSLQQLRKVVEHLKDRGYAEPLSELRFATAGKEIYFQHPDGTWEGNREPDQIVVHSVINLDLIRHRIRQARQRHTRDEGRIERHRGTVGYKPVFAGTRIPVDVVTRRIAHGFTAEQIINAYPDLTPADVDAARVYVAGA